MRPVSIFSCFLLCFVVFSACNCSSPFSQRGGGEISIVAYNVKSLFDAVDDGPEFSEFSVAKGKWDDARYRIRLKNVAEAVCAALPDGTRPRGSLPGPDLLVLEEIENAKVLEALRSGPLAKARYRYAAIAPAEGGPFSVCALSRVPIAAVSCHSVQSAAPLAPARATFAGGGAAEAAAAVPTGRDILELKLDSGCGPLFVFACHWKSKSGGAPATEGDRRAAAALVRSLVSARLSADPSAELLVCGDFNESPDEYLRVGKRYATALMPLDAVDAEAGEAGQGKRPAAPQPARLLVAARLAEARSPADGRELALYSPWAESGGYSYSFRGSRERLDGFLLSPGLLDQSGLRYKRFASVEAGILVNDSGDPVAWPGSGASGYSDHLPILLVLDLPPAPR